MAKGVRVKLNRRGVRDLLRDGKVGKDLSERGRRIAEAAGPGHAVTRRMGRSRQRVSVITDTEEAMRSEASKRTLTRALDAGR